MIVSIIIPTHNRALLLDKVIESILEDKPDFEFEIIVIDNNSTDSTKSVIEKYGKKVNYIFEPNTSFTKARNAGRKNSRGEFLLFLDDDIILNKGSINGIVSVFKNNEDCGIVAGKVLAFHEKEPPLWTKECQKHFNAWSLYEFHLNELDEFGLKSVKSAVGPIMAIRTVVYDQVGGFPPDTIGVETNSGDNNFSKLYIGPGDYGLCFKVLKNNYIILYSEFVSVYHNVLPFRHTIKFWRSRLFGEGYHEAITNLQFYNLSKADLDLKRIKYQIRLKQSVTKFNKAKLINKLEMLPEELDVIYYKAYLDLDYILHKYEWLAAYLWEIGYQGVDSINFTTVNNKLPNDFKDLVNNEYIFNNDELNIKTFKNVFKSFDNCNKLFIRSSLLELTYYILKKIFNKLIYRKKSIN